MSPTQTKDSFRFVECLLMPQPLGLRAANLRELQSGLKTVPTDCLHHHFHQSSLKHGFDIPDFPNDFAEWASLGLEDAALAEKLGNLNPYRFPDWEALRKALLEIVEDRLMELPFTPASRPGLEFHFSTDTALVMDTGLEAKTLHDFRQLLDKVGDSSLYYHFFEARFRLGNPEADDFSAWFGGALGLTELAGAVRGMDLYFLTLPEIRQALIDLVDQALGGGAQ